MARFEDAIDHVLKNEGGYSDNDKDPGGITNFGVSLRFYKTIKADATPQDIKELTVDMAKAIYRKEFWDRSKYNLIASQKVATKVFDLAVNMGQQNANICLQRAVLAASGRKLVIDGIVGTHTLFAVNHSDFEALYAALKSEAAGYYRALILANKNLDVFEQGWLNRAYSNV